MICGNINIHDLPSYRSADSNLWRAICKNLKPMLDTGFRSIGNGSFVDVVGDN